MESEVELALIWVNQKAPDCIKGVIVDGLNRLSKPDIDRTQFLRTSGVASTSCRPKLVKPKKAYTKKEVAYIKQNYMAIMNGGIDIKEVEQILGRDIASIKGKIYNLHHSKKIKNWR